MHLTRVVATRVGAGLAAVALIAHAACTSDDPDPTPTVDGGLPDGSADASGADGAISDAGSDAAPACADKDVPDCSYIVDGGVVDGGALPGDLRCTGLYSCWSTKTVASDVLAFKPSTELWSDGAEKSRWLALPQGTKIDITKHDGWVFPVGTKAFKEFKVGGKRIETRIWQKVSATDVKWEATVYRWSADGESSAKRLDTGDLVDGYEVPSAKVCVRCHQGHDDTLLGVDEWSLATAGATGLTMAKLKELDLLSPAPAETTLTVPEDATGKAAAALAWLNINCGFCHNDGTGLAKFTGLFMDLKRDTAGGADTGVLGTPTWTTAVNQPMRTNSTYDKAPWQGMLRIQPGDAANSLVPVVDLIRDPDGGISPAQMPPLIVRKVDPKAATVRDWIDALPP